MLVGDDPFCERMTFQGFERFTEKLARGTVCAQDNPSAVRDQATAGSRFKKSLKPASGLFRFGLPGHFRFILLNHLSTTQSRFSTQFVSNYFWINPSSKNEIPLPSTLVSNGLHLRRGSAEDPFRNSACQPISFPYANSIRFSMTTTKLGRFHPPCISNSTESFWILSTLYLGNPGHFLYIFVRPAGSSMFYIFIVKLGYFQSPDAIMGYYPFRFIHADLLLNRTGKTQPDRIVIELV